MNRRRGARHLRDIHGVLLLDKPAGISSNAALQKARRLFKAKKAGHTGSLDPLATGLLPLCFGEATKISAYLLDADKHYRVTGRLGSATDTGDTEGEIIDRRPVPEFDADTLDVVLDEFRGDILQVPPMYSALKHEGRRLYTIAREGGVVERKPRRVVISALRIIEYTQDSVTLDVSCSKGTYIRSLVEDIGKALGTRAHVESLRRTGVDPLTGMNMVTLETLEAAAETGEQALLALLDPVDAALKHWPAVTLNAFQLERILHGQSLAWTEGNALAWCRLYADNEAFIGIGQVENGSLQPRRLMHSRAA